MTAPENAEILRRRLDRERKARREAESIAERVTSDLYSTVLALETANRDLETANDAIREFVAVASHDIRGPLTVMLGMAQLLRDKTSELTTEQSDHCVATIVERGEMLDRLVSDLLVVSELELGAVVAHIEDIGLRSEVDRIVDQLDDETILVRMLGAEEITVRADPDHVERIIANYLSNACKYGEPPVEIELGASESFAELRVKDRGPGVPGAFVHRLFTKFSRADEARKRDQGGTGLGLSIVRGLAIANGGEAWYEPNEPNGSCFVVSLPIAV